MSNYLNSIVARSLGIAEVVQPRLPHLFESSDQVAGDATDSLPESETKQNEVRRFGEEVRSPQARVPLLAREAETSKLHPATISPPVVTSTVPEMSKAQQGLVDQTLPKKIETVSRRETTSTREDVSEHSETRRTPFAVEAPVQSSPKRFSERTSKEAESV